MPQTMVAPSIEVFVRSPVAGNGGLVDDFQRRMGCMSRTVSRVQISAKSENIFGDTLAQGFPIDFLRAPLLTLNFRRAPPLLL